MHTNWENLARFERVERQKTREFEFDFKNLAATQREFEFRFVFFLFEGIFGEFRYRFP